MATSDLIQDVYTAIGAARTAARAAAAALEGTAPVYGFRKLEMDALSIQFDEMLGEAEYSHPSLYTANPALPAKDMQERSK